MASALRRFAPSLLFTALMAACLVLSSCTHERLRSRGRTRHYLLHIPESATTPDTRVPLVLGFHGAGGSAAGMRDYTNLEAEAKRLGYVFAFLEGSGVYRSWGERDSADLQFVRDLIQELQLELPIDTNRVYAVGFSSGGRFVQRLACDSSIRLAAFASVASTLDRPTASACNPGRIVSALFVLGSDDPSIGPPSSLTIEETMGFWAGLNGCSVAEPDSEPHETIDSGSGVERRDYSGCAQDNAVVLYVLHGQGHGWPRVIGTPYGTDTLTTSRVIADFLAADR